MSKKINEMASIFNIKPKRRRAVAEIIGSLMLIAITVVGAGLLSYFLNESFVSGDTVSSTPLQNSKKIKLIAYDTRDSLNLMDFTGLNNYLDDQLCGISCAINADDLPSNVGGTEFFVLQVTNESYNSIFLHNLQLNYVMHEWDIQTSGGTLDLGSDLPAGNYPQAGTFSILKKNTMTQSTTNEIQSGQTVNILIKLAPTIDDISLNKVMTVALNVGTNQNTVFLIESGNAI